jgi:LysM repeat protein
MDRKKTILIAIFINAGLLAILFVAALTMQEETMMEAKMSSSGKEELIQPLYSEVQAPPAPSQEAYATLPLLQLPVAPIPPKAEEPVVHHLPPLNADKIAKPKQTVPEKTASAPDYYTVKVGDNPWTIAMKHHMKVEELLRINSLNEEKARKLKPGDRLRIR